MNNFIIKSDKTKDIDRSGYFDNIKIGFRSTILDIPMFLFDAEGETTNINSFLAHKIDPITHEICNTITLDNTLIKLHANGYFYLDKTNLLVLFDVDAYYYLEISNGNKTWNSQIFRAENINGANIVLNSFVANDYVKGIDTNLSATLSVTAKSKGVIRLLFTWTVDSEQLTTIIEQNVNDGDTVILNPTVVAPVGIADGSYTVAVKGSISTNDVFTSATSILIPEIFSSTYSLLSDKYHLDAGDLDFEVARNLVNGNYNTSFAVYSGLLNSFYTIARGILRFDFTNIIPFLFNNLQLQIQIDAGRSFYEEISLYLLNSNTTPQSSDYSNFGTRYSEVSGCSFSSTQMTITFNSVGITALQNAVLNKQLITFLLRTKADSEDIPPTIDLLGMDIDYTASKLLFS